MSALNLILLPLLARVCLVLMFPFSAYDKIAHWNEAMAQARTTPIFGNPAMLIAAIIVELVTPICIVLGWHDRLAAFILAGFCVVTALLYHQFWRFPGFWREDGAGRSHFWDFLKNFGLVGGLVLIVIGGSAVPAAFVLTHPLSAAPYAAARP